MKTENSITVHRETSEPCSGCIHKCLAAHPLSPSNKFSFFRLMLGNFSSFLEISLECSNQIHCQAHKDAILEGPSGRLWHVILCCTGTSSCFKNGWEKFVSDNSIEVEDIIVFRHVINAHFVVQIFGSNGCEKQGVENYGACQFENGHPSTICTPRRCEHKEENIEPSACLENSFNVGQRRNQGAIIKRLATNPKEISSVVDIKEVGKTFGRSSASKRRNTDIVQASYAESYISNDKFVAFDNHIPFSLSKTSDIDAMGLTRAKFSTFRNEVGLSAEQPIILDGEEEIGMQASSACKYVQATVAACGYSALEVQGKSSLCTAVVAPMKQENIFLLPRTPRDNQRNSCIEGAGPKFSLVLCKSAVSSKYWLEIPLKCSNQIHSQACKDAILEGPSGRLWHVILCCTGASSCFKDGWEKFVSDNSIEIEDTVVFRHVSNARFAVQIFGSNGYEKRGASAVESCGVCQFKNRDPSTICTPRKCYHKEENIEPSVCLGNSFNVGQRRNQGAEIKDRRKISSVGDVKEVGKTLARSIPSKRTKADIVQASYAETCISNDKFVVLDNHIPFSPSKTSDVDAVVLTTAKSSTSRNAVGLSAEQPIILDGEEEIDTGALPAHEYVRATAAACGHTALEVPQRKSSLCTAVIAPMKQENVLELPSTKRANQRNDIIQGAEPKFSLVLCRSAVSSSFWLSLPVHVGRGYFKPNDDVLLLSQKDEWQATFKNYGRCCGLKGGWRQFVMDNKLKQGDTCVFELINRINHVLKVDILRADKMDNHAKRKGIQEE